jgi:hypothetical protein
MLHIKRDTDTTQLLCDLLRLSPGKSAPLTRLIITSQPEIWYLPGRQLDIWQASESANTSEKIIDLSVLFGRDRERNQTQSLKFLLLQAGWPTALIRTEVQVQKHYIIDMLVLNPVTHHPHLIFEIKDPSLLDPMRIDAMWNQVHKYANMLGVPWVGIFDGITMTIRSSSDNQEMYHGENAPTPEILGLTAQQSEPLFNPVYSPQNWAEVETLLEAFAPEHIVLDDTLPIGMMDWPLQLKDYSSSSPRFLQEGKFSLANFLLSTTLQRVQPQFITWLAPASPLSRPKDQPLRELICKQYGISALLELPKGINKMFHANFKRILLYLGGERQPTYFSQITELSELQLAQQRPWFQSLTHRLRSEVQDEVAWGYTAEIDPSQSISYGACLPEEFMLSPTLLESGERFNLGDFFEITRGIQLNRISNDRSEDTDLVPVITPRSLLSHTLETDEFKYLPLQAISENHWVRSGDLLCRANNGEHVFFHLYAQPEQMAYSDKILRLRLRPRQEWPIEQVLSMAYASAYLESPPIQQYIKYKNQNTNLGEFIILTPSQMRDIPLILLPLPESFFETLDERYLQLRKRLSQIESFKHDIFSQPSPEKLAEASESLEEFSRFIAGSTEQADQLSFQVSNFYPFPIAFTYRQLFSLIQHRELYLEQIRAFENVMALLGSFLLAALNQEQSLDHLPLSLSEIWQGGISPGGWKEVILAALPLLKNTSMPLSNIEKMERLNLSYTKRGVGKALQFLLTRRNDMFHHRWPQTEPEYMQATQEFQIQLDKFYASLHFLQDYPLRQVRVIEPQRGESHFKITCLRYTGDHPALSQEQIETQVAYPIDEMIWEYEPALFFSLYPFLTVHYCESCKHREIYFIDKWQHSQKKVWLKSFERGHSKTSLPNLVQELERLNLGYPDSNQSSNQSVNQNAEELADIFAQDEPTGDQSSSD